MSDIIWSCSSIDNQFLSLSNIDGKCDTFRTFNIVIRIKLQLKFQEKKKTRLFITLNVWICQNLNPCWNVVTLILYIYSDFIILFQLSLIESSTKIYRVLFTNNEGGDEGEEKSEGSKSGMNVQK